MKDANKTVQAALKPPEQPVDLSEDVKAMLVEYETLHSMQQQVYGAYVKSLVLIVLAVGAIGAVLVNNANNVKVDAISMLAIIFTLVIDTWVAGWAYLHMELWAHRKYLGNLETLLRERISGKGENAPFNFYTGNMAGVYAVGLVRNRLRCHRVLDFCFVFSCIMIYSLSLWLASTRGFDAVAKLEVIPSEWQPFVSETVRRLFVGCSLGVLALAVWAWVRVVRVAKL